MARSTKSLSLTKTLAALGIVHKRDEHTTADQKHAWFDKGGNLLGRFDAHEGWARLAEMRGAQS